MTRFLDPLIALFGQLPPTLPFATPYEQNPPEVNSSILTMGLDESTWRDASMAWNNLAQMIQATVHELMMHVQNIGVMFQGETALAAIAATVPMFDWLAQMQAIAVEFGTANESVAEAFRSAYAAMPPLAEIVQNRVTCHALEGTNIFGINTPEIISLTADYFRMWVQAAVTNQIYEEMIVGGTVPIEIPFLPNMSDGLATVVTDMLGHGDNVVRAPGDVISGVGNSAAKAEVTAESVQEKLNRQISQADNQLSQAKDKGKNNFDMNKVMQGGQQLMSAGSQMMSPFMSAAQAIPQALQQAPQALQGLTQPATQAAQQVGSMVGSMANGMGSSSHDASHSAAGSGGSHVPRDLHNRMHGASGLSSGSGLSSSSAMTRAGMSGADSKPMTSSNIPTPGNLRAGSNSPFGNGMGGGGSMGGNRGKKEAEKLIERRFLDDVDAYGNMIDEGIDGTEQELEGFVQQVRPN